MKGSIMENVTIGRRTKKQSGGSKKIGRNKIKCNAYRAEGRREKNKKRKLLKLLKTQPNNQQIVNALKAI
jgi:hypothetical protein